MSRKEGFRPSKFVDPTPARLPRLRPYVHMAPMQRYWWAPSVVILALLALGPLLSGRVIPPIAGFGLFVLAGVAGLLIGLGFGVAGSIGRLRRRPWTRWALATAAFPLAVGLFFLQSMLSSPAGARFNDVTTDLPDPPVFLAGPATGAPYPETWRSWHAETYPDLAPARVNASADSVFAKAKALAEANDWTITAEDREKGLIQALARTSVFLFEDDVLIRVRGGPDKAVVDLRSRSRVGRGDRGVNAKRIREYLHALTRAARRP